MSSGLLIVVYPDQKDIACIRLQTCGISFLFYQRNRAACSLVPLKLDNHGRKLWEPYGDIHHIRNVSTSSALSKDSKSFWKGIDINSDPVPYDQSNRFTYRNFNEVNQTVLQTFILQHLRSNGQHLIFYHSRNPWRNIRQRNLLASERQIARIKIRTHSPLPSRSLSAGLRSSHI